MGTLDWVVFVLLVVGALNLGIVGLANIDVLNAIFGRVPVLLRIILVLIGLAGLWKIYKVIMSK
ncbi:MAG: DUF378 domain-containing protein [Candidatus Aenigmatarchaeota archaeon]|nr:DUF378 domain-containing protein [Candidatus Aenigmarchaeota archaeon]